MTTLTLTTDRRALRRDAIRLLDPEKALLREIREVWREETRRGRGYDGRLRLVVR